VKANGGTAGCDARGGRGARSAAEPSAESTVASGTAAAGLWCRLDGVRLPRGGSVCAGRSVANDGGGGGRAAGMGRAIRDLGCTSAIGNGGTTSDDMDAR